MKSDSFVSTLIVINRPLASYQDCLWQIQHELDSHYKDYEIVVISQGPSLTLTEDDEFILENIPSIRYIQLASCVSAEVAWSAALENAIGDFVVMFNPATDPVRAISDTVSICKSGHDVVIGVANQPRNWVYNFFRLTVVNFILRQIDYSLPRNSTNLRCLSRRAVITVTATGRFHHQLSMRMQKTGYPHSSYSYNLIHPIEMSRPFFVALQDLLRLIVFNSSRPLRWMSCLGLAGSFAAFIFASYSILIHFFKGHVVEGWTTTILFMSMMFMLQFVMMAFFGEYIRRLLDDRSEQADYAVVFEKTSSVMVNRDRLNVLDSATSENVNYVQTGRDR